VAYAPVCVKSFGKQLADRQRELERRMQHRSKNTASLKLAGGRWTAHDLRRTAAKLMAELGVSGDVIDECLNHMIESRIRRVYIRDRRVAEQAKAFDLLGAALKVIAESAQGVRPRRQREVSDGALSATVAPRPPQGAHMHIVHTSAKLSS
jgi:hypothetical protein